MSFPTRRLFAALIVTAGLCTALPTSAAVTLLGTIAAQPKAPAKLATCSVSVDGASFSPTIVFAQQADPVARYTVALAFFDKRNVSVGRIDITDHGSDAYDLPAKTDSMSCAISRLTLDDGSTFPNASASSSGGAIALGVLGVGAIAGVIVGTSHHGSNGSPQTAAPSATPVASASPSAAASATASAGASASTSPTATATATGPATPTPTPFATTSPTAIPTLRPTIAGRRR